MNSELLWFGITPATVLTIESHSAEGVSSMNVLELKYCKEQNDFPGYQSRLGQLALTSYINKLDPVLTLGVRHDTFSFYLLPKQPPGSEGF